MGSGGGPLRAHGAGHASQNIYLQAASRGLGTVAIGAFYDGQVREILLMDTSEEPLYLMPVGHPFLGPPG